jgi:hypothetical protein
MNPNHTIQNLKKTDLPLGSQKVWYLKLNDPVTHRALWLRFSLLCSGNGFKRVAETWAVFFEKSSNQKEIKKVAIKQTHDISAFSTNDQFDIRIGECELSENHTRGNIQSKGNTIQWDLALTQGRKSSFNLVPQFFAKSKLIKNSMLTDNEELLFSGTTQVNGETIQWKEAIGMQGHVEGPKSGHSWVWGQCNLFTDDQGKTADLVYEGLSARAKFGPLVTPSLSSFYFYYNNQNYYFNTLRDALFIKSKHTLNEWEFQADRNDISFRGHAKAEHKDFAGLTYEDTNGSLLYCANSKLSDLQLLVYKSGKLEAAFNAQGTAAFEVVSREKNPYVPMLI